MKGIQKIASFFLLLCSSLLAADPIVFSHDDFAYEYEEVPLAVKGTTNWFGLYIESSGSKVQEVGVKLKTRHQKSSTLYSIVSDPPGAEILFSHVPLISPGPAVTVARYEDLGFGSREVKFKLGNRIYTVRLLYDNEDMCDAVVTLSEGNITQTLFQPKSSESFSCDEPHFSIHWVGDLDSDERIDLLATFSPKYSVYPRQLFLSSAAKNGDLVSEVAIFTRVSQ